VLKDDGNGAVAGLSFSLFVGVMLLLDGIGQLVLAFKAGAFGKGQLSTIEPHEPCKGVT
jgi:hypothetical protein